MTSRKSSKSKANVQQPNALVIGSTKFKPVTARERKTIDKNKKYYNNTYEWTIDYGKFDKFSWKEIFNLLEETKIQNLWLNNNSSKNILIAISSCAFKQLMILNLDGNKIENLEAIARLDAPKLYRLELSDNYLSDIKSLRKAYFPNLTWLTLNNNPILNLSRIVEVFAERLERLQFRRKPFPLLDQSVNWIMKIPTSDLKKLDCLTFKRIPQKEIKEKICSRYKGLYLHFLLSAC